MESPRPLPLALKKVSQGGVALLKAVLRPKPWIVWCVLSSWTVTPVNVLPPPPPLPAAPPSMGAEPPAPLVVPAAPPALPPLPPVLEPAAPPAFVPVEPAVFPPALPPVAPPAPEPAAPPALVAPPLPEPPLPCEVAPPLPELDPPEPLPPEPPVCLPPVPWDPPVPAEPLLLLDPQPQTRSAPDSMTLGIDKLRTISLPSVPQHGVSREAQLDLRVLTLSIGIACFRGTTHYQRCHWCEELAKNGKMTAR